MSLCPIARITRVIAGFADAFDVHARECGDRVVGVALNPNDHDELALVELWGLPVLATAEVEQGNSKLLCEAEGVLIPPIETGQDLVDHWRDQVERPLPAEDRRAAS